MGVLPKPKVVVDTKIVFKDGSPQPNDARLERYVLLLEKVMKTPMTWQIIAEYDSEASAGAYMTRLKKYNIWPLGIWQVRSRIRREAGYITGSELQVKFVCAADRVDILRANADLTPYLKPETPPEEVLPEF